MSDKKEEATAPTAPTAPTATDEGAPSISKEAGRKAAARRASSVAAQSQKKKASNAQSATDFVKFSRAVLEFQMLALQAQLDFLNALAKMSDEEKLSTLFELLDSDANGKVDARELAEGLRLMDEDMAFAESLEGAIAAVATFDTDSDALLDKAEFKTFLDSLLESLGCTFHELAELIIMQIVFSDGGNDPLEDVVGQIAKPAIDEAVKEAEDYTHALVDKRMVSLFKLFDVNGDGEIDFKEVAMGLFRITENMEDSTKAAVSALLMFDEENKRTLDYPQFTKLILNIVAASPEDVKFEDVADAMTLAACQPTEMTEDDMATLFLGDEMYKAVLELQQEEKEFSDVISALQYGRMTRLFDLWDLDHDGYIDFSELVLGMRKFQDAKHIDATLEESVAAMLQFDENDDQRLDRTEFAIFLAKFSSKVGVDLHELIDFMVVTSALKDNDEAEKEYVNSIKAAATEQIKIIEEKMKQATITG